MKIVAPYARILSPKTILSKLQLIEYAGRISHRSEEEMKEDTWGKFITAVVLKHGDWSITEHVTISVEVLTDRGVTHEIVRHRIAAYTQESTRFVNYAKKMPPAFLYPKPDVKCALCLAGDEAELNGSPSDGYSFHHHDDDASDCAYDTEWMFAIHEAERHYRLLLEKGWRPQEARSVFPNALASKIVCTYNLRTWRHLFRMRTTKETHPQFKEWSVPLLAEFKKLIPLLYDDIEPDARQVDNLRLPC